MHRLITAGVPPQAAAAQIRADGVEPAGQVPRPAEAGGGSGDPERVIRGLVRAARDFDARWIEQQISGCLRELGVVATWTEVLVPMLRLVGQRWESGQLGVEAEHLASASVASALSTHAAGAAAAAGPGPARLLLACAENETHALPLVALHVALLERGLRSHMLGAAVPDASLAAAVRRTGPRVVFLWSSRAETGDRSAYRSLPVRRTPTRVVLGGPGWDRGAVGADAPLVRLVDTLPAAVDVLSRLVED